MVADLVGGKASLAKMTGISESQIYRYIREESGLTAEPLVAIAKAGGVLLEWLATGEGPMHPEEDAMARVRRATDAVLTFAVKRSTLSREQLAELQQAALERGLDAEGLEAAYGSRFRAAGEPHAPAIHIELLRSVVEEVQRFLEETGRRDAPPELMARLIAIVYDYMQAKGTGDRALMKNFLKLVDPKPIGGD